MLNRPMKIALAQVCSSTVPAENLALVRSALSDAEGADLVVFPEATMASFATASVDVAEPLDGPFATAVRALAAEFGTTIAVGLFTPAADGRCRNTLLVTGPAGEASYDKLHLFDAFGFAESDHVQPGERPVTLDVAGARLGLAICYDLRFPDLFIHYARCGARVVLVPASWQAGPEKLDHWRTLARARALDSTCFVVACGQAAPEASGRAGRAGVPRRIGHSRVAAPVGRGVAAAGEGPQVLIVDIDPDAADAVRETLPVLANARFDATLRPAAASPRDFRGGGSVG